MAILLRFFCLLCLLLQTLTYKFPFTTYLQEEFEHTFHARCQKYPFVQLFVDRLENPSDKFIMFVYQEPGLKNGGLGDRLAGLVSAIAIALRMNRTLLIRYSNGLDRLFRPYHPEDLYNDVALYSWENYTLHTSYKASYADNDNTEYDMWDCINNTGRKIPHCSLSDTADVAQVVILYRSNRSYLCHYDAQKNCIGHQQMKEILGVTEEHDLYEVGGCLLRLALWPTPYLWEQIDAKYAQWYSQLGYDSTKLLALVDELLQLPTEKKQSHTSTRTTPSSTPTNATDAPKEDKDIESRRLLQTHPKHQRRHLRTKEHPSHTRGLKYAFGGGTNNKQHLELFYQIGMHFRCGDRSYIQHNSYASECLTDSTGQYAGHNSYMQLGNPYEIGTCAAALYANHTLKLAQHHRMILTPELSSLATMNDQVYLQYITSDNDAASGQMNQTSQYPYSFLTPQGCHIELDPSAECHVFTVTYWMMLALSHHLIVQRIDPNSLAPASSFSRYAGMYGLYHNPFRPAKECDQPIENMILSRTQHGSWFC